MAAYSIDLRQKILRACERRFGSQRIIADVFGVSLAFVEKVLRQHRTTGNIAPKPHAGGQKPRLDSAAHAVVQRLVGDNPDATLQELCAGVAAETGVRVSVPTMCRVLRRLWLAAQKKPLHASERDAARVQEARAVYRQRIAGLDCRRLTFVDESGVNLALTQLYGRAPQGEQVVGSVPQNYGPNVTLLGALGIQGLQAVMTVDGATDTEVFRTYVKQVLGPTLAPGDIVVMDNLRAHKAAGIQQAIARRGARRLYMPPYSPDLSPIEPCWSKVKTALRQAKAHTREALDMAITGTLVTVTSSDAHGWFRHCGYALQ